MQNDLNQWLTEMENVGGPSKDQLPENTIDLPELQPTNVQLDEKQKPEGLREVRYSPPGREPKLFEQMRKPENQPQAQQSAQSVLEQRLQAIQEKEQQNQQQKPADKPQEKPQQSNNQAQEQSQPPMNEQKPSKSPIEIMLEAAVKAAQEEQENRRKQEEERQQQKQDNVSSEALELLEGRVDNLEERVEHIEANYVGSGTFQDTMEVLNKKLANISKPHQINIPDRPTVTLDKRPHTAFAEVLFLAQMFQQVYIVGPAGTGKTTLAGDVAQAMSLDFGFISCTAGMAEAHLLGRLLADGRYLPARFVELYEKGGVFLFDEVDAADANTMLVINSALANGILSVPNRPEKPQAVRHPDFVCIVAANTLGTGSFEYHGRNYLDAAFLDRFALSRARVDYDIEMEHQMLAGDAEMCRVLHKMRSNLELSKTRRVLSTRAIRDAAKLLLAGRLPQYVIDNLTLGWTEEEKNRALKDVVVPKNSPLIQIGLKQREAEQTKRNQAAAEARKTAEEPAKPKQRMLPGKDGEPVPATERVAEAVEA